jgi:glyoxylase-like metal-dependent hydrolase (beta-lactamase superfamily II)
MKPAFHKSIPAHHVIGALDEHSTSLILDVREPDEYKTWHIQGSINIPLGELYSKIDTLPQDKEILVICASGNRSSHGCHILDELGFNVINVDGGMNAWGNCYDTAQINVDEITVLQLRRRGKGCLSYIVGSDAGTAFVIDPTIHTENYLNIAEHFNWRIEKIFDTHLHADHLSGTRLLSYATNAPIYLNPHDTFNFDYTPLKDGELFYLSEQTGMSVLALETPGHTKGSVIFNIKDKLLFTGDTLFVNGIGRPDLADKAEEFANNLYDSLHQKLLKFDEEILILPAHYSEKTVVKLNEPVSVKLKDLKASLESLGYSKQDFIDWMVNKTTDRPSNYKDIIKLNMGKDDIPIDLISHIELGPNRCSA